MYVCLCKSVTDREIEDSVDTGIVSFEGMQKELDVSTCCGSCACEVKQIIRTKLNARLGSMVGNKVPQAFSKLTV